MTSNCQGQSVIKSENFKRAGFIFSPTSSQEMNVNVLRHRKKSNTGIDTIEVPNPEGLLQQEDDDGIDTNDSLGEFLDTISSPQMNVDVLRQGKKSSSGIDDIGVPNPDGLLQQEEEDEIDKNDSVQEFLSTILKDYDNEKEEDNKIDETAKDENFFLPTFGIRIRPRDAIGSTESGFGFITKGSRPRRIRRQHRSGRPIAGTPIEQNESAIDVEAERSSIYGPDHGEDAPNVTGLSSQSPNAERSLIEEANKYLEWVFILTNLVLEILLVVLDQIACPEKPQYALTALALSLVAIAVSVSELSFKAQKEKVILRRQGMIFWFQYPSSSHNKPFYTFIDVFGFICAVSQFIFSAVAYSYHSRHADNPININIVSLIFIICLACSKLIKDLKETPVSAPV